MAFAGCQGLHRRGQRDDSDDRRVDAAIAEHLDDHVGKDGVPAIGVTSNGFLTSTRPSRRLSEDLRKRLFGSGLE